MDEEAFSHELTPMSTRRGKVARIHLPAQGLTAVGAGAPLGTFFRFVSIRVDSWPSRQKKHSRVVNWWEMVGIDPNLAQADNGGDDEEKR